ncbi:MAG: hypothetical protein N2053_11725, partial [Chitinispirillaceae bacterium]|nr:hypothetical protein [Chitinispirillaceae bacterium]
YYKDYSDTLQSRLTQLSRPLGRDGWNCESALISPDGKWIAFNVYKSPNYYEIWVQKLSPTSKPFLFKEDASDPHWWRHPYDTSLLYLVYQDVPGDNLVMGDLSDKKFIETGELGITYRQMIRLFDSGETEGTAIVKIGEPEVMVKLPTKGGLSPDGKYLCTGYDRGFIIGLP